jgi:predicted histidine transporter YuiF (NhaC family)
MFLIDDLYRDARQTLFSLYKFQEKFSGDKNSFLLLILTLYTVVGGIYGMNQVIEDLKGNIKWNKVLSYSIFEHIALFITVSGLVTTAYLAIINFLKWRKDKKNRDKWATETALKNERQAD